MTMEEVKIATAAPFHSSLAETANSHTTLGVNEQVPKRTGVQVKIVGWNDEESACFFKVNVQSRPLNN